MAIIRFPESRSERSVKPKAEEAEPTAETA
jgi:hypothetical protein